MEPPQPPTSPPPRPPRTRAQIPGTADMSVEQRVHGQVVSQSSHTEKIPTTLDNCPHPAYVSVRGGLTEQPIPYNSIKIEIGITLPCLPVMEGPGGVEETYKILSDKVEELIQREKELVTNGGEA